MKVGRKLKSLTIDRAKWGYGKRGGNLHDPETKLQCCLGFACRAVGVLVKDIANNGLPHSVSGWDLSVTIPSSLANSAVQINDDPTLHLREREKRLIHLFKNYGIELHFKGKVA